MKIKNTIEMMWDPDFKKKQLVSLIFESFSRSRISLGIGGIMGSTHIYLAVSNVYARNI